MQTLKPKPDIAPKELQGAPMDVHLKDMRGSYGNIILLSLIEQVIVPGIRSRRPTP